MADLLFEFLKPIILAFINFMVFALIGKHLLWGFLATFVFMFIYLSMDYENSRKKNRVHNLENYGHGHGHGHTCSNKNYETNNKIK